MATSQTYFWTGVDLAADDADLLARFRDARAPAGVRRAAFRELLGSDRTEVRGVALDGFTLDNAQSRHGDGAHDLYDGLDGEIRACALRELAAPPYQRTDPHAVVRVGANHASALHALSCVGEPEDAAAVAVALGDARDPQVLDAGLGAAQAVLYQEAEILPALADVLRRVLVDGEAPSRVRVMAIDAAGNSHSAVAATLLLAVVGDRDLAVAAAAARALLERDRAAFHSLVTARAARWPTDGALPADVARVRRLLAEP